MKQLDIDPNFDWEHAFKQLNDEEQEKLALLRVIECTNGVVQYMLRDDDADKLTLDETRTAMKFSMASIKNFSIELSDQVITFDKSTRKLMKKVRDLYLDGAKNGNDKAYAVFLEASKANLRVIGMDRLVNARVILEDTCDAFPKQCFKWGMSYIFNFAFN